MGQEQSTQSASKDEGEEVRADNRNVPAGMCRESSPSLADTDVTDGSPKSTKHGLHLYGFLVEPSSAENKSNVCVPGKSEEVLADQHEPFAGSAEEQVMAVNFGDDKEQRPQGAPDGRYVNQFGEVSRSTSYKLFRGGNGSVDSLTSLAQFASSERGSGSVPDLNGLVIDADDDKAAPKTTEGTAEETERFVTKNEVLNQFGCVQRVESCVLFGVEDEVVAEAAASKEVEREMQAEKAEEKSKISEQYEGVLNQFGTVARVESCVLFGVEDEVEGAAEEIKAETNPAAESKADENEPTSSQLPSQNEEVLNQFGAISSHPSCALFGVEDDAEEAALKVIIDEQIGEPEAVGHPIESDEPFSDEVPQEDQVAVDFGDEEERSEGEPKGRYVNQFGEIVRNTSYNMLRGGTGSVNSLTSLNQFGGSELGSSLGSVCELNVLEGDKKSDKSLAAQPDAEAKHAPVTEVVNQFGHIARVESAALFRTDSASSLALSGATAFITNVEEGDGDFF